MHNVRFFGYLLLVPRRVGDLLQQFARRLLHHSVRLVVYPDVRHDGLALHEPRLGQIHRARDRTGDATKVSQGFLIALRGRGLKNNTLKKFYLPFLNA